MTVRRALMALATLIAGASILFAAWPFHATGGVISGSSEATGGFLLSTESCRAPILHAGHGKRERFAISLGTDTRTPGYVVVTTCQSKARHRLGLSIVGLLAGIALGVFARSRPDAGERSADGKGGPLTWT